MYMIGNIALLARMLSTHKPKIIIGARSDFNSVCKTSKNAFDEFLLKKLSYTLFKKSDQIIAVSKGVKKGLIEALDFEQSKVKVIYKSIEDIKIMMNETIVESLKKRASHCLPFFYYVHYSFVNVLITLVDIKLINYISFNKFSSLFSFPQS